MAGYPGKQGARPKPTAVKVLQGNPGKRALPPHEPQYEVRLPKPPEELTPAARAIYRRVGALLVKSGVMTVADGVALARYAEAKARWLAAVETLGKEGELIPSADGELIPNPLRRVARQAHEEMRQLEAAFGLTPLDRTRIHAAPPQQRGELTGLAAILARRRELEEEEGEG